MQIPAGVVVSSSDAGPGGSSSNSDDQGSGKLCLVAIGRLQPTSMPTSKDLIDSSPTTEFITRQTLDGRFSFVDQRYVCDISEVMMSFRLHTHNIIIIYCIIMYFV